MSTDSLEATEKLGAAGTTHPRITLDHMKEQISCTAFITGNRIQSHATVIDWPDKVMLPTKHVTVCMMVMKNGFCVIGKSAPMSPENFDDAKNRTFAYEDCIRQLWPLYAFAQLQAKV